MKTGDLVRVTKHGAGYYSTHQGKMGIIVNMVCGYPKVLVNGTIVNFVDGETSLEVIR
jgi:hypothetical protein|tara:strand:+ start:1714 stop:1887 length:174 start_codon:yes stop_codon:yes gene_type:complete